MMKKTSKENLTHEGAINKMAVIDQIPEDEQELVTTFRGTISKITDAINESTEVTVIAESHIDKAGFYIKHFKTITKILETIRMSVVKPKNDDIKKINGGFKYFRSLYQPEERRLIAEVESVYKKMKEQAEATRIKEQKEHDEFLIQEAISFDDDSVLETKQDIVIKTKKVSDSTKHIKSVRQKTWTITDSSKIPIRFLMLCEKAINAERMLHDFDAKSTIEGIEFTYTEKVTG